MNITLEYELHDLESVISQLYASMSIYRAYAFSGSLGAGKTTIIKALLMKCGVNAPITSPTFTYVNCYQSKKGIFYHFDCYRLSDVQDFIDLGFCEYLYHPDTWSFVEWPEIIVPVLPENSCYITIEHKGETKRLIHITEKYKKN